MIQREQFQTINNLIYEIYKITEEDKRCVDVFINTKTNLGNMLINIILNKPFGSGDFKYVISRDSTDEEINKIIEVLSLCKDAVFYNNRKDTRKGFEAVRQSKLKEIKEKLTKACSNS